MASWFEYFTLMLTFILTSSSFVTDCKKSKSWKRPSKYYLEKTGFFAKMMIQGIGDEVISVLIALVLVVIISLVWHSTHVQERPLVRAVVIRSPNSPDGLHQIIPNPDNSDQELLEAIESTVEAQNQLQAEHQEHGGHDETNNRSDIIPPISGTSEVITSDETTSENADHPDIDVVDGASSLATIKVRFINETSLEIKERLTESLGRFISKHLQNHLNLVGEDRVKLIYNGRVLGRNQSSTLEELGLTDNCVIHCLVQRAPAESNENQNSNQRGNPADNAGAAALDDILDFDVSNICLPLLGLVLVIIWWCQMIYSQYFNVTSTVSLVSLTILFLFSVANTYFTRT